VKVAGSSGTSGALVRLGRLAPAAIAAQLSHASIFCLPARYEPFGLSALEAALSGCALVLGDIPSLREVWGDAALFVPPNDSDLLAAALQQLIDDPNLRANLAKRAFARAQYYDLATMADRYRSLYRALVRQNSFTREAA
jgi:glycosyltransferase involved in cell wall biosynthesis